MQIQLRPVTRENYADVIELRLLDHQCDYVASNAASIAQASFYPEMHTRAIYAGDELVGFLLYVDREQEGKRGEFGVWRMMIDIRHQGKGYGRKAMQVALDEIRARGGVRKIWIAYQADNTIARDLYASLGFVETETDEDDEVYAVLEQ